MKKEENIKSGHKSNLVLANDVLMVEVASPQSYEGTRFGKGAFITQITYCSPGNAHTFCANELETDGRDGSFQGGSGLCHEFGIFRAVGYDEAQPGEWFPKLDTGLLQRANREDYRFHSKFEIQPFHMTIEQNEQEIRFISQPAECRGYAVRIEQNLRLEKNRLSITSRLENCGSKPVNTNEYRHNFLAFDGRGPEPGLRLRIPFEMEAGAIPETTALVQQKNGVSEICWRQPPETAFFRTFRPSTPTTWWEMEWPGAKIGIREEVSRPLSAFHLFATGKLISPEAFVEIAVQPGQLIDWERIYTFYLIE